MATVELRPPRTLLLESKLAPPKVRRGILRRARLLDTLDEASAAALTLVTAPAGYGKTVLLSTWAAEQRMPVIWVTLDPADCDPVRLWTHAAAAASRASRGLGSAALEQLAAPGVSPERAVDTLLATFAAYGEPLALVLDDVDSVGRGESTKSIAQAVARLPANLRLIAAARADPPIALARLRGRHLLAEIRARDLAFTPAEARELLVRSERIPLTDETVARLVERTEGWPVALYLSALWLRDKTSPNEAARVFGASSRQVSDYLTEELLESIDPERRNFLRQTALLRRFSPPLCDAVLARDDSREILAELERENLLLVSLDSSGDWYRYHALFEELLLLEPPAEPEPAVLHRRAASWLREHGIVEEAIAHAAAGGDVALAAEILAESGLELARAGRAGFIAGWLDRLPPPLLLEHPLLTAGGAVIAALVGRSPLEVERLLLLAERSERERPDAWLPICDMYAAEARSISIDNDDAQASLRAARRAVEVARASVEPELVPALAILARALFFAGDLRAAWEVAHEAVTHPDAKRRPHGYVLALGLLAAIEAAEERPEHAAAFARDCIDFARHHRLADSWLTAPAHIGLAGALLQLGELETAEREAQRAEELRHGAQLSMTHAYALLCLAEVQIARSRLRRASSSLAAAQHEIAEFGNPGRLADVAAEVASKLDAAPRPGLGVVEWPSPGELAVLRYLPSELTQREISAQLYLSLNTVRTHVRAIYRKLNVGTREAAVARADSLGLLEAPTHQGDSAR